MTSSPTVVVAAAMSVPSGFYRPVAERFAEHGWRTALVPTRGFDRDSPRASRHEDWSYASEARAIAEQVAAARRERPTAPVVLLGHSLGAQIGAMHQLHHPPADGFVVVGASLPHFRTYPYGGLGVLFMGVSVPVVTRVFGFLPPPFFGSPGPRTLMREWATMIRTGRPPFDVPHPIGSPSLVVSLQGDALAVRASTRRYVETFLEPSRVQQWTYRHQDVPEGGSTDHVQWVRTPGPVVDHVVRWWDARSG